jgi:hypothetical protein
VEVRAYSEDSLRRIGFGDGVPGVRIRTPTQLAAEQSLFFEMRHVSRAFEQLGGESVRQLPKRIQDGPDPASGSRRQTIMKETLLPLPAHGRELQCLRCARICPRCVSPARHRTPSRIKENQGKDHGNHRRIVHQHHPDPVD